MIEAAYDEAIVKDEGSEKSTDVGCDTSSQASESDDQIFDQPSAQVVKEEFLQSIGISDLNVLDSDGKSALQRAAKEGNADVTRALLDDEDFQHVNTKDKSIFKWTALHEASEAGNIEMVKILMDHERFTQTNSRDRNGRTCLHLAAGQGNLEVVEIILSNPRFASMGIKDHLGFTPQQRAKANGHQAVADYIQACVPCKKPPGLCIMYTR
jgi:ankyrin repeat protein